MQKVILCSFFLIAACIVRKNPPTRAKFITFEHQGLFTNILLLIHKVHADQWQIGYRFASHCPVEFRKEEDRLKQIVVAVLRVWLQPLRDISAKPIVNDFRLLLQPDYDGFGDLVPPGLDTRITFLCEKGFSSAAVFNRPDIEIGRGIVIDKVYIFSITHELGHAFGLADTYSPGSKSTGGLADTRGMQPSAVMASLSGTTPKRKPPYIKEDDRKGIIWLYKFTYENQPLDDCFFLDYVFEPDPAGCRPKYPLIHEIKYGHYSSREEILDQDPNLDINARDINGRTALHYAVMYKQRPVVKKLLARADLSPYLRDKEGKTAADIAKETGQDDIAAQILAHPRALSVTPKGKKPLTWGELKRPPR